MITHSAQGIPVIAISGVKNSGKTTLITNVLPLLRQRGMRIGVLKHDGHGFEPDVPGKDSYRIRNAGAELTAVYDQNHYMLIAERADAQPETILSLFCGMDLILLEGFKRSAYQKIELVRAAVSSRPSLDPSSVIAICADVPVDRTDVPVFALSAYAEIADFIARRADSCRRDCVP